MLEKSSAQVTIGFRFDSDWLKKWCEFPGPIIGFTSFRYVIGPETRTMIFSTNQLQI